MYKQTFYVYSFLIVATVAIMIVDFDDIFVFVLIEYHIIYIFRLYGLLLWLRK